MIAAVTARAVRDRRRSVIGYGIGIAAMTVWVMALYPSLEAELDDYIGAMPEAMQKLFGMDEVMSLAGFVYGEIFSLMGPLVFLALAITSGAGTLAGEERERVLPIVLATGIGRGNVVVSKLAALTLQLVALGAITLASVLIGVVIAGGGITVAAAAAATVQLIALGLLFGVIAVAAGAITGSKAMAAGTAVGIALGTYIIDAAANLVGSLEWMRVVSPFHWYAPTNPLIDGLAIGWLALLLTTTAALAVVAVVAFDRRDIGT